MKLEDIKTPAYVCQEAKLRSNLNLLSYVAQQSGENFFLSVISEA